MKTFLVKLAFHSGLARWSHIEFYESVVHGPASLATLFDSAGIVRVVEL